jgi:O-antigen/teichoic acid export membrane protein
VVASQHGSDWRQCTIDAVVLGETADGGRCRDYPTAAPDAARDGSAPMVSQDSVAVPSARFEGGRQVAARALSRIGARAVSSLSLGIFLVLTARATEISEFGMFMLAYSVGLVLGIVAGVGAPIRVLRAAVEQRSSPRALFEVHTTLVLSAFAVCSVGYAVLQPGWATFAGLVLALGDTCMNFAVAQTTAQERHGVANSLVLVHRLVPLVVMLFSYFVLNDVEFSTLTAAFAVTVLVGLIVPPLCMESGCTRSGWRSALTGGAGFWAYSISALLSQLQVPALAAVTSTAVVAQYAMATRVVGPATILTTSVSIIVVPELAKRIVAPLEFNKLFRGVLVMSAAYFAVVTALAWPIAAVVIYLVGPQYRDAQLLIIAMVIGAGISGCSMAFNSKLLAIDRPEGATRAIVAGGVVALIMLAIIGVRDSSTLLWLVPIVSELVVIAIMASESRVASNTESNGRRARVRS